MKQTWILFLVLFAAGCGDDDNPIVAEVGLHQIKAASLRTFVEELAPGLRTQKKGDDARRHYLQSMIDRRLLLMETKNLGLDTTSAVTRAVQDAVDARVRSLYRGREIASKAHISEEEVRSHFETGGYDKERKLEAILVKDRAEIEKVVGELAAGRPFAEVASLHSLDERSAQQGGVLGFIGREAIARLYVPPDVFSSLPPGEVSKPLRAGKSWHLVRFTEERPAAYERYRPMIEEKLFRKKLRQVEEEHLELLKESFQVRIGQPGLRAFIDAYRTQPPAPPGAATSAIYLTQEGKLTVAAAREALQRMNIQTGLADSTRALSALEKFVLRPWIMAAASRRAGIYEEPEIRAMESRKREDILLEALRKIVVGQRATVADAEVWEYYDNHPDIFYHEDAAWAEELLLPTEAEALHVKQQIAAGAPFADFAERSLRAGAAKIKARFHFHPREEGIYPLLVPVLLKTPPGELTGPLEVKGGYSVFRVASIEPGGIEPFETAQRRAGAMLRRERETQALESFVVELREKYASQIEIHESRMAAVLPDELLGE